MLETASYVTKCSEDEEGNLVLEFPDGLLEMVGWKSGDVLDISTVGEQIVLRKLSIDTAEKASIPG